MPKIVSFFAVMLISLYAQTQINYSIAADLPATYPNLKIELYNENDIIPLTINNGRLNFRSSLNHPGMLVLVIDYDGSGQLSRIILFVTGGEINLRILENKGIEVSGNKDVMDCFYKITLPVLQWNLKVGEMDSKLSEALRIKSADTSMIRQEYINAVDACFQVPQDFINANPQSLVSIQALYYMEHGKEVGKKITLTDLENMYMSLDESIRTSDFGKQYAADLVKWKSDN